ncbi:type IV secretion system protein [Helicobacter sp.]|uniref:type IV secretion system protein n=1 Tax=Helicobacter sp. TaxID=218 RepID=UPI0019970750|nr:type IV secretion system protein [Helicobacter sp.]MBD5165110.1 type IV secretion system protein [Helicobacter sp.]
MILILAITSICIVTKFMATIILSIAPIVIPCLMMNQLRGYFFSWLKLYLSYSMYAPIAMIIGNFPMVALEKVELIPNNVSQLEQVIASLTFIFFKPIGLMIVAIIAIMILIKVPSWVNQILGTQNDDAVGLAPLKAVGSATTTGAMTGGAGLIAGAGIKAALGRGITSMLPMGQTATKLYDSFKKSGGSISNGKTSATSDFFK